MQDSTINHPHFKRYSNYEEISKIENPEERAYAILFHSGFDFDSIDGVKLVRSVNVPEAGQIGLMLQEELNAEHVWEREIRKLEHAYHFTRFDIPNEEDHLSDFIINNSLEERLGRKRITRDEYLYNKPSNRSI